MRTIILLFAVNILFNSAVLAAALQSIDISFHFSTPTIVESSDGVHVNIPGANARCRVENHPEMPCLSVTRTFPFGTRIESVEIRSSQTQTIPLPGPLSFSSPLQTLNSKRLSGFPALNPEKPYPSDTCKWAVHGGLDPVSLERKTFLYLRIFPAQYLHENQLLFIPDPVIRIHFALPSADPVQESGARGPTETLVIISPDQFIPLFEPFLQHKSDTGLPNGLYSVESILSSSPGFDDAAKIKHFIRSKVEMNQTLFVLLAGDADQVPVRYAAQPERNEYIPAEGYFSDLYDAEGNPVTWDADQDGVPGTYPGDLPAMDLMADVFVSRIPASTLEEMQIALQNVINYETLTTPTAPWFNTALCASVDIFNEQDHGDTSGIPEGEDYSEFLFNGPFYGMNQIRLYETDKYPHDAQAEPDEVVAYSADGCGFMAFHCHGAPNCFWLIDQCFTDSHCSLMRNEDRRPAIFGFACSTAAFDNELPGWPYGDNTESMPEHFLLKPYGGGISYVGATRYAVASHFQHAQQLTNSGAMEYFYFKSFREGVQAPAQMMAAAQKQYLEQIGINDYADFLTVVEYAQFGDASVALGGLPTAPDFIPGEQVWTEVAGNGDGCPEAGEQFALSMDLINAGAPATNVTARLRCWDPEISVTESLAEYNDMDRLGRGTAGAPFMMDILPGIPTPKIVQFSLEILVDGMMFSTYRFKKTIGDLPYLILTGQDIYSDIPHNGNIDPGDTIYPAFFIRNTGCITAQDVRFTLTTSDPNIVEVTTYSGNTCGDIPPGIGARTPWGAIEATVRETCPDNTRIAFELTVSPQNGPAQTIPVTFAVHDRIGPDIENFTVQPQNARPGQSIRMTCRAFDVSGINEITAEIQRYPEGQSVHVALFDDGMHADGSADDGIFGCTFETDPEPGNFIINIQTVDSLENIRDFPEIGHFSTTEPIGDVLLVNASGNKDACNDIVPAIESCGVTCAVWDNEFKGVVQSEVLSMFHESCVIWTFGRLNFPGSEERRVISDYISTGGGVLISGWDAARGVRKAGDAPWLDTQFGVLFKGNNAESFALEGVAGDPLGDGLGIRLYKRQDGANLTADRLEPADTGHAALMFKEDPEAAGMIWRRDTGVRTVFLSFALERVRTRNNLEQLLARIVPWLTDHPGTPDLELMLNQDYFRPGDSFHLEVQCVNPYPVQFDAAMAVFLGIGDVYFCYPSWSRYPPHPDFKFISMAPFSRMNETILDFTWPDSAETADGLLFLGAVLNTELTEILSDIDTTAFGFGK